MRHGIRDFFIIAGEGIVDFRPIRLNVQQALARSIVVEDGHGTADGVGHGHQPVFYVEYLFVAALCS